MRRDEVDTLVMQRLRNSSFIWSDHMEEEDDLLIHRDFGFGDMMMVIDGSRVNSFDRLSQMIN